MCGRYVLEAPEDLSERFQLRQMTMEFPPRFNVAPTDAMPVIVIDKSGERVVKEMKWGLVPNWAKPGEKRMNAPINAKAETLRERPMFKNLLARRRCLVPANGFYEWKTTPDGKQPYLIFVPDEKTFALAGLYDFQRQPDGEWLTTYTIVTTAANDKVAFLHDRMPVILDRAGEEEWLDISAYDETMVERLLVPYPADQTELTPVSRAVNSVRNDTPDLIEPITLEL